MKKFTFLMATGLVAAVMSLSVQAATSGPFTTSTPIPSTLTDWSGSLAFPQFNSALGTLNSVELDLSATFTTTLTVSNSSPDGSSGTVKTEVQFTVQDIGGNLVPHVPDVVGPDFAYSLGAGGNATSGLLSKSGSDSETYTLSAILTEFTGGGSIVLPASTFTQTLLANTGGNTSASQITDGSLTGDVIYNYTAVPEPSTIGLVVVGLLGVLGIRRRKA